MNTTAHTLASAPDPAAPPTSGHAAEDARTPAVQLHRLTHRYPAAKHNALDQLSLSIAPGEAFALLGPNGGGKTTTFRILATLLHPNPPRGGHPNPGNRRAASGGASGGDPKNSTDHHGHSESDLATPKSGAAVSGGGAMVSIFGHDAVRDPAAARRAMGVVFQSPSLDIKLSARENLACQARLYGLSRRESQPRITDALARFNLTDRAADRVETFSGGMKRKLEIAKALLHRPRLLLMDEPATGLDPAARRELWEHLNELRRTTDLTIAWTTHLMDEAEHADRLAILADGRLLVVDRPANLKAATGTHIVSAEPTDPADLPGLRDRITEAFGPWTTKSQPAVVEGQVCFEHADGPAVVARVAELLPGGLHRIAVGQPTLEDAYLRLIAASTSTASPSTEPSDLSP